ncbi:hypothetical protein SAMN05443635_101455 [Roseobacter denitrificans OCh 114]|nr:hypothetical protein SAMN05443635_101455 [Roseobacter denitrificans OCh 114]
MTDTTRANAQSTPSARKISLPALTAMVVGSMVGAGIFNLPARFGSATGPFGAIIAWMIAGTGMYMLARVFQFLAQRRPNLDSGVFATPRRVLAAMWAFYLHLAMGPARCSATCFTGC